MEGSKPISFRILLFSLVLLAGILVSCGQKNGDTTGGEITIDLVAADPIIAKGSCTIIEWNVQGGFGAELNGEAVESAGQKSICPENTTTYKLSVDMGDRLEEKTVEITVLEEGEEVPGDAQTGVPDTAPGDAFASTEPAYKAQTWVRLGGPPGGLGYDIRMQPDNPDIMYVTDANAGIHKSIDGGKTWVAANSGIVAQDMGGTIPIFCLTIDPHNYDTVWAGTQLSAHIYRSTDAGQTWVSRDNGITSDGRSVRGITIDPNNPNIIYAGLEVSSTAWNGSPLVQGFDLTKGEVYKSTDAGQSWTRVWEGNNLARYIWVDPRNSNRLYVSTGIFDRNAADSDLSAGIGGGVGVLRSDDGGQTWTELNEAYGLNGRYIPSLFMHPDNPDILIAATSYLSAEHGVWATYDGGDSWQKVMASGRSVEGVEIATSDPAVWYAAGEDIFWRSDDAGQTWEEFPLETPDRKGGIPIDIQVDPRDSYRVFINNYGGGNMVSEDGGETWVDASKGYTGIKVVSDVDVAPDDSKLVFARGFRSMDGGQTWLGIDAHMGDAFVFYPLSGSNDYGVIATTQPGEIFHSTDHGETWQSGWIVDLMVEAQAERAIADVLVSRSLALAPSNPTRGYVGFAMGACTQGAFAGGECDKPSAGFYRTNDIGYTWEELTTPFNGVGTLSIAVHPDNPDMLFVGTGKGFYRSSDGGNSWQEVTGITIDFSVIDPDSPIPNNQEIVYDIIFDPFDSNILYAAVVPGAVWRSADGGQTWEQIAAGMDPNEPIYELIADTNRQGVIYASSGLSGVFYTTDGGQTWIRLSDGLTHLNVHGLGLSSDGSVLYAGTVGSGVFRLGPPSGTDTANTDTTSTDTTSTEPSSYEVTIQKDIVYGTYTADGQSHNLLLDLYLPKTSTTQLFPVIVYIHGGGWFEGSRDMCPGNTFASRGYAVACVEYRLAKLGECPADYIFPVQIYDIKSSVRWLRLNRTTYGLDSNRIAAMGNSSGGHLAALLGTSYGIQALEGDQNTGVSDEVQAVVDWYGPVDIVNGPSVFADDPCTTPLDTLNQVYGGEDTQYFYWTLAWGVFLGGSLQDQQILDRAVEATPLTYIDPSDPPFLILHGEDDGMVPISQSEMLVNALLAAGVDVTFLKIPGASHNYASPDAEVSDDFLLPTIDFLEKYLGN